MHDNVTAQSYYEHSEQIASVTAGGDCGQIGSLGADTVRTAAAPKDPICQ